MNWSTTRVFSLACLVLLCCDAARSKRPLTDPASAKLDPRLIGDWSSKFEGKGANLHLVGHSGGQMDLVLVVETDKEGAAVLHYQGHESVIDGATYLNLRAKRFADPLKDDFTLSPEFIFVKVELAKDGSLRLSWMSDKPVDAAIQAGKLKGSVTPNGPPTIDDEPANILAFIKSADPKTLWTPLAGVFRRVKR